MVLLLIVLAVTAVLIVFWVSGLVLRFVRRPGRAQGQVRGRTPGRTPRAHRRPPDHR